MSCALRHDVMLRCPAVRCRQLNEHGIRYRFNFAEVYWNSRLQSEHDLLVSTFKASDVICACSVVHVPRTRVCVCVCVRV